MPLSFVAWFSPAKSHFSNITQKLTLIGGHFPWQDMTIVGSLFNLEVLKLKGNAFDGPEWEPNEGEFLQLKFLLIELTTLKHWRADSIHFPTLHRLVLKDCYNMEEIPSGIGEILTLQMIELHYCTGSLITSAKKIQEEQQSMGNNGLHVRIIGFDLSGDSGLTLLPGNEILEQQQSLGNDGRQIQMIGSGFSGLRFVCCNKNLNISYLCGLKKLILEIGHVPWKDMTIVGLLPNLQVLRLKEKALAGPEWEPSEGEFLRLKFWLLKNTNLEHWRADCIHFPTLQCLAIKSCHRMNEISYGSKDIPNLELIDLRGSSNSTVTLAGHIH